jgi:uncharacterized damage-inducible protein DinB
MNKEILQISSLLQDSFSGDPWYGRSVKSLLKDVSEIDVFEKPNGQHSILELLWHMIIWREFTINRWRNDNKKTTSYFEENDWRDLDHDDKSLWKKGLQRLDETQSELIEVLEQQQDNIINETVPGRTYNFKKLLYGIIQHDIYHVGQIAYLTKLLQNDNDYKSKS